MNVRRKLIVAGMFLVGTACSSSSSTPADTGSDSDAGSSPKGDAGAGKDSGPNASTKDSGSGDAGPTLDRTPVFDITIDGAAVVANQVKVSVDPENNLAPAEYDLEAIIDDGPNGSGATFTVTVAVDEAGAGACASNENGTPVRDVSYFYKADDDGLHGIGTSYVGGACSMTIDSGKAEGFSSGTASGTLGGYETKSFTVTWGQSVATLDAGG